MTISGAGLITRRSFVRTGTTRTVALDAIVDGGGFDLSFYRQFVRDDVDAPGQLRQLRRQTQAPQFYLRTVDESGISVDANLLDATTAIIVSAVEPWSGGRFGAAGFERGSGTREGQPGWVTVKWYNPSDPQFCGRGEIGGTQMWLEYLNPRCGCGGSRIAPISIKHELGHVMGFYHTDGQGDVMYAGNPSGCDANPSARERYHAAIAYSRPVGNADPDDDSERSVLASPLQIILP
jgi:hypothetical protein